MSKSEVVIEVLAGFSLGMLTGLISGLSASPVVPMLLGTIAASLLVLLGFKEKTTSQDGHSPKPTAAFRLLSFGFSCSAFLVLGVFLRTHNTLSPSLKDQEQLLQSAHFTPSEVHQLLLWQSFGISGVTGTDHDFGLKVDKDKAFGASSSSVLFAGEADKCLALTFSNYHDMEAYLEGLGNRGGVYAELGVALKPLPPESRENLANTIGKLACK
jgi:hypothetical protein